MAGVNFFLPGVQGNTGLNIGIGPGGDFSVGLRDFARYGNGIAGGYNAAELGFSSRGGLYAGTDQGRYNPFGAERQTTFSNAWGNQSNYTAGDVFGNFRNDRYANNVFGGYSEGHTAGNPWAVTNSEYSGNVWGGPQFQSHGYANAWGGGGGWSGVSVPGYGQGHYHGCGGGQVGGWFGGGCF